MNNIDVSHLYKFYPDFSLQDVSFALPAGCIMGLIGENGAGKTTTLKMLLNIVKPDQGEVRLFDLPMVPAYERQLKEQIGIVWEDSFFYQGMNAKQVQTVLKNVYWQWDSTLYQELLDRFSISPAQTLNEYSRGMRMKLMIAAALAHHPKLLILDEATSGLDPIVRNEILDLFLEFIQQEENSILFSSHITGDLDKAADYITYLHNGRVLFSEEKDKLHEQYAVLRCGKDALKTIDPQCIVRVLFHEYHCEALVTHREKLHIKEPMSLEPATTEQIMLFFTKGESFK